MSGVKGRSGRKPMYNIRELDTTAVLSLCQSTLLKWLKDEGIPLERKQPICAMLYSKAIKTTTDIHTTIELNSKAQGILDAYDSLALGKNTLVIEDKDTEHKPMDIIELGNGKVESGSGG